MSAVRRFISVVAQPHAYLSLGYLLLRLPLALIYGGIIGFILFRGLENVLSLLLLVPAGLAIWGGVLTERAMARDWFGAGLTPMSPDRPLDRTWAQRIADLASNPVTWRAWCSSPSRRRSDSSSASRRGSGSG